MTDEKKTTARGGRREGAGRPASDSRLYAFRAPKEMADYIDSQDNKTEFIKECIALSMEMDYTGQKVVNPAMEHIGTTTERMPTFGEVYPATRVKPMTLPFFDIKLVAGFPIPLNNDELAQEIELLRLLCPNPDASYLIRVMGDSMIDAGISDGDILIVDKSNRTPSERQAAVCELNGEYTVKYVRQDKEGRWLVPANEEYPRIRINEGDDFSVWGVVTYVIHKPG